MNGLPLFPVYLVDFLGALLMVYLSISALHYAALLKNRHPKSVLFSYLFWLSMAFVALSISRSFGHAVRFMLVFIGRPEVWSALSPVSGGLNTITFVVVGILTFYYPNVRRVMGLVKEEALALKHAKEALEVAHEELRELNRTLEERVRERTQELLISEQKFRRLYENSKDAIFFCDGAGCISDMNQSGVELLGYATKDDVVGRPMKDFFDDPKEWRNYYTTICHGGYIKDFEARFKKRDGSVIYVIISAAAIKDETGEATGCEGIAKDVTTFKKMTEKLVYSEKMAAIGQLAAGVAHEINTPLGIILGYAQLLKEDFEKEPTVRQDLETIEKQAKTCKRIVADLLSFARSTSAERYEEIDVNECVKQTVAVVRHTMEMDQIQLELRLSDGLPRIYADKDRFGQVVLNILTNAHQAIGEKGRVILTTGLEEDREKVVVDIGDSGPGIPPDIQKKIFDPFFTTKPVGKGTGLGLSVSYGIIREFGGNIEVFSPPNSQEWRDEGINTLFRIELPAPKNSHSSPQLEKTQLTTSIE